MSSYSKVPGYEVNTRTSIAFPQTSNEQVGLEIQSTIPSASAPKNEMPRYKSTEYARGLSEGNGRTLTDETKGERDKWRGAPWSWLRRLRVVATSVLPERISGSSAASVKTPARHFVDTGNTVLKPTWRDESQSTTNLTVELSNEDAAVLLKQ